MSKESSLPAEDCKQGKGLVLVNLNDLWIFKQNYCTKYTKRHWHKLPSTCSWSYFFSELIRHSVIHSFLYRNFLYQCSKEGASKCRWVITLVTYQVTLFASWMKILKNYDTMEWNNFYSDSSILMTMCFHFFYLKNRKFLMDVKRWTILGKKEHKSFNATLESVCSQ